MPLRRKPKHQREPSPPTTASRPTAPAGADEVLVPPGATLDPPPVPGPDDPLAPSESARPEPPVPATGGPGDPPGGLAKAPPTPGQGPPPIGSERSSGEPRTQPAPAKGPLDRTRSSSTYVGVAVGVVVLILILDFIIQNLNDASVHFLGLHARLPVGLLILVGVVAGGLIVLIASLMRLAQIRVRARREGARREH